MPGDLAGQALPAFDGDVYELGFELDETGSTASPFRRNERRAGTAKRIKHDAAAV